MQSIILWGAGVPDERIKNKSIQINKLDYFDKRLIFQLAINIDKYG